MQLCRLETNTHKMYNRLLMNRRDHGIMVHRNPIRSRSVNRITTYHSANLRWIMFHSGREQKLHPMLKYQRRINSYHLVVDSHQEMWNEIGITATNTTYTHGGLYSFVRYGIAYKWHLVDFSSVFMVKPKIIFIYNTHKDIYVIIFLSDGCRGVCFIFYIHHCDNVINQ